MFVAAVVQKRLQISVVLWLKSQVDDSLQGMLVGCQNQCSGIEEDGMPGRPATTGRRPVPNFPSACEADVDSFRIFLGHFENARFDARRIKSSSQNDGPGR